MESNHREADAAGAALAAVTADRERLAQRLMSQTWWTAPAQAFAIAALIASPAAGFAFGMMMVSGMASVALFSIDHLVRKKMRLVSLPGPKGPLSLTILVILCIAMLGAFAGSIYFEVTDQRGWIVATTIIGFIVALASSALYDVVNTRELLRVR